MGSAPSDRPIAIIYDNNGIERPNVEADYRNNAVKTPACLIMMDGADYGHGSRSWDRMTATVT